jgi:hypothetical protein
MDPIRTHQELLLNLAGNGDPSAFSTLIVQYANATYITERNSGKSHKEALSVIVPFIKSAYQDFIKTSPHKAFDAWYREYKRKYFSTTPDSSEEINLSEKVDFGNVPMADIAHFERIIDIILQRKYGKIKKAWNGRLIGRSHRLHDLVKTGAIIISAGILLILLYYFLVVTKQRILLAYSFHNSTRSVELPFSSHPVSVPGGFFRATTNPLSDSLTDSLTTGSNKVHDTVVVHDTVRITPRWKPVVQNKAPAAASPGNTVIPPPISSQPPAPSVTSNKQASPSPAPIQGTTMPKTIYDSLQ